MVRMERHGANGVVSGYKLGGSRYSGKKESGSRDAPTRYTSLRWDSAKRRVSPPRRPCKFTDRLAPQRPFWRETGSAHSISSRKPSPPTKSDCAHSTIQTQPIRWSIWPKILLRHFARCAPRYFSSGIVHPFPPYNFARVKGLFFPCSPLLIRHRLKCGEFLEKGRGVGEGLFTQSGKVDLSLLSFHSPSFCREKKKRATTKKPRFLFSPT